MSENFLKDKSVVKFINSFLKETFPSESLPLYVNDEEFYRIKRRQIRKALIKYLDELGELGKKKTPHFTFFLGSDYFISFYSTALEINKDSVTEMKDYVKYKSNPDSLLKIRKKYLKVKN